MLLAALSWADSPLTPAQFTLAVIAGVFVLLVFSRLTPDVILIGAVVLLLLCGVLNLQQALGGLSNEGMITIAVLFVVGAGVRETGAVDVITARLFGRPKTPEAAITRMMFPTMGLSALMNNTPLVAMMIPAVSDWARTNRFPVSKLMIPLSYAAILGGTCTLIGTSTNLVVQGMLFEKTGQAIGMFDISWVGIPAAIAGGLFIICTSRWLLPDRRPALSTLDDPREYTIEMQVAPDSPLVGKTIEGAGLRHLPGVYLAEIDRDGNVMPAVSPQEVLRGGDRLLFVGIVESVVDLQRIRGLLPATDQVAKLSAPRPQRCLIEAVVSNSCPLVGKTIRDGRFRNVYNAVVVAVARNGERLQKKIGDIVLRPGDTLLVEAHPSFADQQRNSRDFFLVSRLEGTNPPRHDRAWIAMAVLVGMVTAVTLEWLPMLQAALVAAALLMMTRCIRVETARRSIDWEVLLAIAASLRAWHGAGRHARRRSDHQPNDRLGWRQSLGDAGHHLCRGLDRHRADHQQRGGGTDVSLRAHDRQQHGRQLHAVYDRRDDGRQRRFCHADRLPDQPDGLRPRRLPFWRLRQNRRPARHSGRGDHGGAGAAHLAVLTRFRPKPTATVCRANCGRRAKTPSPLAPG